MNRTVAGLLLLILIGSLQLLGMAFPRQATWGFHGLAYLPLVAQLLFLGGSLTLVLLYLFRPGVWPSWDRAVVRAVDGRSWLFLTLGVMFLAGFLFLRFPIMSLAYGDARNMAAWHGANERFDWRWITDVFSPRLLDQKEALTIAVHRLAAHFLHMDIEAAYRLISALSGVLFVGGWMWLLKTTSRLRDALLPLLACGLLLGANQLFFGQVENYPFAFLCGGLFFGLALRHGMGRVGIVPVLLAFLVAFRAHAIWILVAPALPVLVAASLRQRMKLADRFLAWRYLSLYLGLLLLVGAAGYLLVCRSYRWEVLPAPIPAGLFLPVVPPAPPYHRYHVLAPAHLMDLFNIVVLVAAPAFFLLVLLVTRFRRSLTWHSVPVKFGTCVLVLMAAFYAMVNPVLSMPRDWDLFSLLALPILFLLTALLADGKFSPEDRGLLGLTPIVAGLLTLPLFLVNSNAARLSQRLEDIGEYAYATYYSGSSVLIQMGQNLDADPAERLQRREATLDRLHPWSGGDPEYGFLMAGAGDMRMMRGDTTRAESLWKRSLEYDPGLGRTRSNLVQLSIIQRRPREAIEQLDRLIQDDPKNVRALHQGIGVALTLGDVARFRAWMARLRAVAPLDPELEKYEQFARQAWPAGP